MPSPLSTSKAPAPAARAQPWWPLLALSALLVSCSLLNIYVIQRDTVPMVADSSGYYRTALHWYQLLRAGEGERVFFLLFSTGIRPPLPQLVTVGCFLLFGDSSQAMARLSVLPFLWILLISVYAIGTRLRDRQTGLVAALLLACFPQVIGYSRIYWMDIPLSAMTALCIWALLTTEGFSRGGRSIIFGLVVGLGMLTKYTLPVFVAGPTIYVLVSRWLETRQVPTVGPRRRRKIVDNCSLAILAATSICGIWYFSTFDQAWSNFLFNQGAGVLVARTWWTLDNLVLYPRYLVAQLGPVAFLSLLVALPLFYGHTSSRLRWLLLLWIAVPYLFFTFFVLGIQWSRFTLPYLPAIALIIALGTLQFRFHPALRGLTGLVCVLCAVGYITSSFAAPPEPITGTFVFKRVRFNGLLMPQSYDFHLTIDQVFPRSLDEQATHVALFPDAGNISSLLETWAAEQQVPVHFSVPYEPEGRSFGSFRYPARAADPAYLRCFHYVAQILPPKRIDLSGRRRDLYHKFLKVWGSLQRSFEVINEIRMPNGYRVLVHRQIDRSEGPNCK